MYFKNIKNLRLKHNYTQEYVARYLKINRVVYSRYETGIRDIPVDLLLKLSYLYKKSIDYIVDNNYKEKDDLKNKKN